MALLIARSLAFVPIRMMYLDNKTFRRVYMADRKAPFNSRNSITGKTAIRLRLQRFLVTIRLPYRPAFEVPAHI